VKTVQYGLGENGPRSRVTGELVCGDVTLSDEELAANRADFGQELRDHPLIDDYFNARIPDWSKITAPLLSAGNWGGYGLHLRGNSDGYVRAGSEQKWLELHGLEHWTHYYTDYGREIQLAFFDHFLHGKDNGWDTRPRVLLNVRHADGRFERRDEAEWPIARTEWTKLYLDPGSSALSASVVETPGSVEYDALSEGVTFRTVLDRETEITGPLAAKILASSSTADADLFLIVRVFDPAGNEITFQGALDPHTPIAHGWLRASHRALDVELSTPYRPFHPHARSEPLTPGEIYELDIEIWPTCLVIPAGYTLALTVQGKDYQYGTEVEQVGWFTMTGVGPFKHDDPSDRPAGIFDGRITLHAGGDRESYLLVPVVP
jgi:predicted acyl esterase